MKPFVSVTITLEKLLQGFEMRSFLCLSESVTERGKIWPPVNTEDSREPALLQKAREKNEVTVEAERSLLLLSRYTRYVCCLHTAAATLLTLH